MGWSKLSNILLRRQDKLRLSREESMVSAITIIVPLYIYPNPGAWSTLHESIQNNATVHFLIIINPGNGPGPDPVPDANYLSEIPKLTAYCNVDVVGYVHTSFAQRDIAMVLEDIRTYSKWAENTQHPQLGIKGIFVDETPNQFDLRAEKYLRDLTEFAKTCRGFGGDKLVIHNPGCVPAPAYMGLADIIIVFEDNWQNFGTRYKDGVFDQQRILDRAGPIHHGKSGRDKLAVLIHSVPPSLTATEVETLVKQAKQTASIVFVTDLDQDYYSRWSTNWARWVKRLSTL